MTLEKRQANWLYRFTHGAVALDGVDQNVQELTRYEADELRCQLMKESALARATDRMAAVKDDLREKLKLTFEVHKELKPDLRQYDGDKKQTMSQTTTAAQRGGDDDFDTMDARRIVSPLHENGVRTELGGKIVSSMNAMKPLADEAARLRDLKVTRLVLDDETKQPTEKEVPLFSDQEIERGLYTPLVREQVVPETFVPDRYSADAQMMKQSDEDYIKECRAKAAEAPSEGDKSAVGKAAVTLGSNILQFMVGVGSEEAMVVQGLELAVNTSIDIGAASVDAIKKRTFNVNDFEKVCNGISAAVGKIMSAQLRNVYGGDFYGQLVGAGLNIAVRSKRIYDWVKEDKDARGPFPAAELRNAFIGAASGGLAAFSDKTEHSESTWLTFGATATKEIGNTILKATPEFVALGSNPDPAALKKLIASTLLEAAAGGAKAACDYAVANKLNSAHLKTTKVEVENIDINRGQDVGNREKDAIQDAFDSAAKLLNQSVDEEEKAKAQDALTMIEAEKKNFEASLERLGELDPERALDDEKKSIGALIGQIERDRLILEALCKIPQTAAAFEHFFKPLQAAGALGKFIINVTAAYNRTKALDIWRDANQAAISSGSPYATAIQNFVGNQEFQRYHACLQAVLQFLQAGTALAGAIYAPLFGASLIAKGAAAGEDAIYQLIKQNRADQAWSVTKVALANPGNRRLGHAARRLNPTLAKYSIAYGAMVARDPIAVDAMNRCGLDRETLARPESNIENVKKYLESLYKDDPVVLGPVGRDGKKETLPTPVLSLASWKRTLELLRRHKDLAVSPPHAITFAFKKVSDYLALTDEQKTVAKKREIVRVLNDLADRLKEFVPTDKDGLPIRAAIAIILQFSDLAAGEAIAIGAGLPAQAEQQGAQPQAAGGQAAAPQEAGGQANAVPPEDNDDIQQGLMP